MVDSNMYNKAIKVSDAHNALPCLTCASTLMRPCRPFIVSIIRITAQNQAMHAPALTLSSHLGATSAQHQLAANVNKATPRALPTNRSRSNVYFICCVSNDINVY